MQLILLAAGMGKRLPKKFRNLPKCMATIKNKTILEYNKEFYEKFEHKVIVTGYKRQKLKYLIKKLNLSEIYNKEFKTTNMVHSLFKVRNIQSSNLVICYTDIIFDKTLFSNLNKLKSKNIMPLKKNWLNVWKGRMSVKKIFKDAEDLEIKDNTIKSIGSKIKKKLPKYQYMGILKITKNDFFKLKSFYKKINNKKIDLTNFINFAIRNKILKINPIYTNKYWFEIDNIKDKRYAEENL
jgi:choline kinase